MTRPRIFVTQPVAESALERLRKVAEVDLNTDPVHIATKDELLDAVRSLRAELAELRAVNKQPELLPLAKILSISPRAALGRLERDEELRKLGLRVGRRVLFRPDEVRSLYGQ